MPALRSARSNEHRHNPLAEEYSPSTPFKQKAPKKRKRLPEDEQQVIDTKASRQILRIGRELEEEDALERKAQIAPTADSKPNPAFDFDTRFGGDVVSEESDSEEQTKWDDEDEVWGDEEVEEVEVEVWYDPYDYDCNGEFEVKWT